MNRYDRQTRLPQIAIAGQQLLARSSVVLIGCGALGTVIAEQLVRGGIGELHICDRDVVELSNLQRQTLFTENDARDGIPKALAAASRLSAINSSVKVLPRVIDIHSGNIESLLANANVIIDATDNIETRYLLNDAAVKHNKPWIYGAAIGTTGRAMGIIPTKSPCLRCLFPDPPVAGELPTCDTTGVLAATAAITASLQVTEAIKILLNDEHAAANLITFDLWPTRFHEISTRESRRADCPTCGQRNFEFLTTTAKPAVTLCGRDTVQVRPTSTDTKIDLKSIASRLGVQQNDAFIHAAIPERNLTLTLFPDGRALVHGTSDPAVARSIYAKFIGS